MTLALAWSSGKDAAWALYHLRQRGREVAALVTTVERGQDRVAMHGVRRSVLRRQAAHAGVTLVEVELPWPCSNELYEFAFTGALRDLQARLGITAVAFGDLYLRDVRSYREGILRRIGFKAEFPLWGMRTDLLAKKMLEAGVEAHVACLDPTRVDRALAGARWDAELVRRLPPEVDPCGERGEFHTVVTAGPMFARPVPVFLGDISERDGLVYADLSLLQGVDG